MPVIQRRVDLYVTKEVDVITKPKGDAYDHWAEEIYDARGQLGLLVELNSLRRIGEWDRSCEGTVNSLWPLVVIPEVSITV